VSELDCNICLGVCVNAVETGCCHHLFCESCLTRVNSCPCCRHAPVEHSPNIVMRRMISNMVTRCEFCEENIEKVKEKEHAITCPMATKRCPAPDCGYSGLTGDFIDHLVQLHKVNLLKNVKKIFDDADPDAQKNDEGSVVQFSKSNKKPYCLKLMHICGCKKIGDYDNCKDYNCGPDKDCNCLSCMKLDLKLRKLPPGSLINNKGRPAVRNGEGKFFCRATYCVDRDGYYEEPWMDEIPDPVCGFNPKHTCNDYQKLDYAKDSSGIYTSLMLNNQGENRRRGRVDQ